MAEKSTDATDQTLPRRTFLGGIATAGAASAMQAGGNQTGGNQTEGNQTGGTQTEGGQEVDTHFRFGGRVEGWQGQSPSRIEGETNPALDLKAGNRYRVTWENLDGVQHNFTIQDSEGNNIASTETMSEQGATRSLMFTATPEMDHYICTIHPNTMIGRYQIGGGTPTGATPTEVDEEVDTQFELGGRVEGWQGQSPSRIEGETNPTLNLQAGTQYRVTWENLDGVQHNFAILDADGNEITSTEITSVQGETRSLTFTATEAMDQYYCAIHTVGMRGDIRIGDATPTDDTPIEDRQEFDTVFELGAVVEGWQGRLPEKRGAEQNISGEKNPTLELEAGNRYMVIWENADGVPHNFAIRNAEGNEIIGTKITSEQGEQLSLTFTASEEMDHYLCVIHPDTMRGYVQFAGVGNVLTDPGQMVGGLAAVTAGSVVGLAYVLSKYFEESTEP